MSIEPIRVQLSHSEALVLYDWLVRPDESNPIPTKHKAEEIVLWLIEGQLEKILVDMFAPDYEKRLERARIEVEESH